MIPKIVHYAWFGSKVPSFVQKRVNNWQTLLPNWKFVLWNEDNFDLSKFKFSQEMYNNGKLGFVADELRYYVVNKYGGFYFDTDILVKKNLAPFLDKKTIWGYQYDNSLLTAFFGSEPSQDVFEYILDVYKGKELPELQNYLYDYTSNPIVTQILKEYYPNFKNNGQFQELEKNSYIYPKDYFAYLSRNKKANFTEHLLDNSWGKKRNNIYTTFKSMYKTTFPYNFARISAYRGKKREIETEKILNKIHNR